jgi:glyoxylase-like metal-dependent hydrolase (beta-lactamase superfamily II)
MTMRTVATAALAVSLLVTAAATVAGQAAQQGGRGAAPPGAGRGAATPPLVRAGATEKISEHVYVIPDNNVGQVPNVGIIVGSRATLVVDTGLGARNGRTIMSEVEKVSRNDELYLVTTHVHPEHDLGAGGFTAGVRMIRSQDQVAEIKASGLEMAKRFMGFSPLHAELLEGAEFRPAGIVFDREHVLDLGGVRVRILAMGFNHTRGDTAIFVEPDAVLFSGDVAMTALPAVGAGSSVAQWLDSQARFAKLQPKRIVPSHGPMGDLSIVTTYQEFLQTVQRRVAELKKQGRSADEAVSTLTAELAPGFGESPRMGGTIRTAYNQAP